MSLPFPFGSVNRAIESEVGEGPTADALRDLAKAAGAALHGVQNFLKLIPVSFTQSPYPAVPSAALPHPVILAEVGINRADTLTIVLPAGPTPGQAITVKDVVGVATTGNDITIDGNGQMIDGQPTLTFLPFLGRVEFKSFTLVYAGAAPLGWRIIWDYGGSGGGPPPPP
jgi:hypothetical protein